VTTRKTHAQSLRSFLHTIPTPTHARVQADLESSAAHPPPPGRLISGPSLRTFDRWGPEWLVTDSDVFRNASSIPHPLIDHPDIEQFQRPKEWGRKTPDLLEAEAISQEMRELDQLRQEGLDDVPDSPTNASTDEDDIIMGRRRSDGNWEF
jgi:hypothetical protein